MSNATAAHTHYLLAKIKLLLSAIRINKDEGKGNNLLPEIVQYK